MGYQVIHDPQHDVHALIDPDYGRALGPVVAGPDGQEVLEQFVGALGVDPATIPPWILEVRFQEFLSAITSAPPAGAVEPAGLEQAAAPGGELVATAATGAPTDEPPPPAPADTDPGAQPAAEQAAAPGGTRVPGPGEQTCPECDGWGTVAQNGAEVTCPACQGTGVQPAQTAVQSPPGDAGAPAGATGGQETAPASVGGEQAAPPGGSPAA